MNKKDRKALLKGINECLGSLHMPVEKPDMNDLTKNPNLVAFSQICNDHVCGTVVVAYDEELGVLDLKVARLGKIPPEKVKDMDEFLNQIHTTTGTYYYRRCPCCNDIELRADLYVPEGRFPVGKLKKLLKTILEDTYLVMPYIRRLENHGGDPNELFESCRERMKEKEDEQDDTPLYVHLPEIRTILSDMAGIGMPTGEDPEGNHIGIATHLDNDELCTLSIRNTRDFIILEAWPDLEFGKDKMEGMLELINVLNSDNLIASHFHIFENDDRFMLRRVKVIMLENDQLDKEEFRSVFERWIGSINIVFPLLWTRLVSDQELDMLIEQRSQEMRDRSSDMNPPTH